MQGKISHGGRGRLFWVNVQHQPDRGHCGHCGQEDGILFNTDIRWLDSRRHRRWTSDDTAFGQQLCQGYQLPGYHRWWNRDHLRYRPLPDPGIHPSNSDCSCHGPLRVLTQLWIRESLFRRFPFSFAPRGQ
jgi:hypothetical protein